ncbi:hypothetical protein [Nocardia asteroides]|uniref:hypothetical protein n=1 Tax=Nocardia asteroides TaxID=1824 RepID=UPI0033C29527
MTISPARPDWVPEACALPTVERPIRVAEFDRFFAEHVQGVRRPDPARLELVLGAASGSAGRDLAARESSCCSFFTFDFDTAADLVVMRVGVPTAHIDVLDAFAHRVRIATGGPR